MEKVEKIFKQSIKGFCVFCLFYFSSYFRLIPILLFHINTKKITGVEKVALSLFSNIVLLLILLLIYRKELKVEWKRFKDNLEKNLDSGLKYWIIGLVIMFISNIFINIVLKNGQAGNEKAVQQMISNAPILMLINAGLIGPIIEEITFRKTFKNVFSNKWAFILISGIFFGSLHVIGNVSTVTDWLYIIPYSGLGISFAYMYYKTDTIYTSMTMHMIHNTIITIMSIL